MKKAVLVLVVAAFLAGFSAFAVADNGPAEIKFSAKMGDVTFAHTAHQAKVADCTECHHKGVDAGTCKSCHDGSKAAKSKDAFHKQCKGCHKKMSGPTGCKGCHKK